MAIELSRKKTSIPSANDEPSEYGIYRVDDDASRTHGWRLSITRKRITYVKLFSDSKHSGRQNAYAAAIIYRDEHLRDNPPMSRAEYGSIKRKNNSSGVPGVCRISSVTRAGSKAAFWLATWPKDMGGCGRKKFSIERHGENGAFELAMKARSDAMANMDTPYINTVPFREWNAIQRASSGRNQPARRARCSQSATAGHTDPPIR